MLGESVWLGVCVGLGVAVTVGVLVPVVDSVIVWEAVGVPEGVGVTARNAYSVWSSLPIKTVPSPAMAALPDTLPPVGYDQRTAPVAPSKA